MAETRIYGSDGAAAITGHVAIFNTWSATITQNITEVTGFGDTWANNKGGVKRGTMSAGGFMSYDASSLAPAADSIAKTGAAVTLTLVTGCTYGGTAVLSNVAIGSTFTGDATITFDGTFDGAVTETWDETP